MERDARAPEEDLRPGDSGDAAVLDAYLDAALDGRAEDPEAFLARHPGASPALRVRIEALGRAARPAGDPAREPPPVSPGPPADGDLPFERLGDFRLLARLGEGGMGTVYRAEQVSLGRIVALKVVRADLRNSASAAARFEREARAAARLSHPNIVALHAVGEEHGVRYLAMDLVPGRPLDEILAEAVRGGGRVAAPDALRWGAEIADALHCAHTAGIVHRDVKPSNVLVTPEGRAMLLDFGVAREIGADGPTIVGSFVGSPVYAAPEQVKGAHDAVGPRSDVYSLGAMLYECLTGRPPVRSGTLDQVFQRVLAEEPAAPRSVVSSIPRDAEIVVRKAMEKDPGKRYATAAEFAEDLRALLAFRPIRARAPGPLGRLRRWARRNPAAATASAALAATLLGGAGFVAARERAERLRRADEARVAVAEARGRLDAFLRRAADAKSAERDLALLEDYVVSRHLDEEQHRRLDELEMRVCELGRDRETTFHHALDDLRRAERLDPGVRGADEVRGLLFLEKWREAVARRESPAAAFYRDVVLATVPGSDAAREVDATVAFSFATDPPGAQTFLWRYEEQADVVKAGERRLVPVPLGGTAPIDPGTRVAEVVDAAHGDLAESDLVTEIGGRRVADLSPWEVRRLAETGGADVRFVRGAEVRTGRLAPATHVRITAAPLLFTAGCCLGVTPVEPVPLRTGEYLALLRHEDCTDQRVAFVVGRGRPDAMRVRLAPRGAGPTGFVRVARPEAENRPAFWIAEREVTCEEYAAFLNDPATLRDVETSARPIRFPRGASAPQGHWKRAADGTFRVPESWARWPVLGISLEDARAYVRWLTARGGGPVFELPTFEEFVAAGQAGTMRRFVFGNRFRPRWVKSCFAVPQASPEPVLSYPVDESPAGVFDLAGSVQELCESWYDEGRGLMHAAGGAWGQAKPELFGAWAGSGVVSDVASDEAGIRLVVREAVR